MPKGIYKRKKKAKRGRPTTKASTKRRGLGRPPGSISIQKKTTLKPQRRRRRQGASGGNISSGLALIAVIQEMGRLFDARTKLLVDSIHEISDAIREAGSNQAAETGERYTPTVPPAQVNDRPSEEGAGVNQ
jgi:hypothetical protein